MSEWPSSSVCLLLHKLTESPVQINPRRVTLTCWQCPQGQAAKGRDGEEIQSQEASSANDLKSGTQHSPQGPAPPVKATRPQSSRALKHPHVFAPNHV